jgi:predicted deacylase
MTESSRIRSDIDYDKRGKQVSHLAVPSSTNDSAYGTVTVPIAVFNHGTGPTFFITGGVHGDEYEGPVSLMNLIRELEAEQIEGRLIVIPCLNLPAVMSGNRCSPVDGLNMNRVFPGSRDGTITEMIAHYVCQVLLPMVDIQLDLHSGGNTLEYIPSMMMWSCPDPERRQRTFDAVRAFGAPISLVDQALDSSGILSTIFEQAGILNFGPELGGAGRVDPATIRITATGLRNLLKHFGMVEGDIETPESQGRPPSRLAEVADLENYVMAPDSGIYESFVDLWDVIDEGRPIGQVHYPDDLGKPPRITHAPRSGFLLCKRPPGQVKRGDNIAIIGQDLDLNKHGLR